MRGLLGFGFAGVGSLPLGSGVPLFRVEETTWWLRCRNVSGESAGNFASQVHNFLEKPEADVVRISCPYLLVECL